VAGEQPDQPDVLQRRFNYFDYAADGQLDGAVSIQQWRMLAQNLMPAPDAFVVLDRQRSSGNGYLLDARKERNYVALQYTKPTFAFVPAGVAKRFQNISPRRFGVNRGALPGTGTPQFTLFEARRKAAAAKGKKNTKTKASGDTTQQSTTSTGNKNNGGSTTSGSTTTQKSYSQQAIDNFLKTVSDSLSKRNG
jgi:hypothetical protein